MTALRITGLSASYGAVQVLDRVNLSVPSGAFAAVLGPSGCGKTTMFRVVAGFHAATSGTVHLDDRPVVGDGVRVPAERRRVGVVPQEGALFPHLSVAENVGFGLSRGRDRRDRIAAMLELVGLTGAGHRSPHELSGGQQQRVALARALAPRPDVVLLDEPFAALDAGLRQEVRTQVRAALKAEHVTAVLVTHDQEEALSMADTVAVMRDGRIVQQGEPDEVYRHPRDPWIATFVGDAVIVPATVVGGEAVCALGRVPAIPHDRSGPGPVGSGIPPSINGDSVLLRPEQLRLVGPGHGIPATVEDVVYFGHDALATLRLDGTTVQTRVAGTAIPEIGSTIGVLVDGPGVVYPAVITAA